MEERESSWGELQPAGERAGSEEGDWSEPERGSVALLTLEAGLVISGNVLLGWPCCRIF